MPGIVLLILLVLVIVLLGGFAPFGGGEPVPGRVYHGYGFGGNMGGLLGILVIVVLVLLLLGHI